MKGRPAWNPNDKKNTYDEHERGFKSKVSKWNGEFPSKTGIQDSEANPERKDTSNRRYYQIYLRSKEISIRGTITCDPSTSHI